MSRQPFGGDAEARAAARLSGVPGSTADGAAPAVQPRIRDGICRDEVWRDLAGHIFRAAHADFIGIVPRALIEAMRETGVSAEGTPLPPVRYFTPTPESVLAGQEHRTRTRLANRWQVGLRGLRNLVKELPSPPPAGHSRFLFGLDSIFVDCVILLHTGAGDTQVYVLSELPGFGDLAGPSPTLLVHVRDGTPELVGYIQQVMAGAGAVRLREVACRTTPETSAHATGEPAIPPLVICHFTADGAGEAGEPWLWPVAIVVLRCHTPAGLELLMKRRTRFTDNNDFDKISLLSSRLQESDVAAAVGGSVAPGHEDDRTALENLWMAAGSGVPFLLPPRAFAVAAQREVYITCGLEIPEERLQLRGYQCIPREGSNKQLGFAVFTVDLVRSREFDEVRWALTANPDGLVRVPVDELYSDRHQLNRLLTVRRGWLQEHCFASG